MFYFYFYFKNFDTVMSIIDVLIKLLDGPADVALPVSVTLCFLGIMVRENRKCIG